MDGIDIVQYVRKTLLDRKAQITELMSEGGIKDMEHYKGLMGELKSLDYLEGEIKNLLDKQEQEEV